MFYDSFTDIQKSVLLDLIDQLIMADGVYTYVEKQKYNHIKALFSGIVSEHVENDELKNIFKTRKDRISVMLELISISESEENVSDENRNFIENICKHLNISEGDINWMKLWVENIVFLYNKVNKFMED